MSLAESILKRRSIRRYKKEPLPADVLETILEAGRLAPSANNRQPWRFIVITDEKLKKALATGRWNWFIKDAPVTIVGCGYCGDEEGREWSTIDTIIALQSMVLAAWIMGVGSCWIGDFAEEEVKRILEIQKNWKVISLVSFGYPDETPLAPRRKSLEEIVNYNRFLFHFD